YNLASESTTHVANRSLLRGQLKVQPDNRCTARPGRAATSVTEDENFQRPADGHQGHDRDRDEAPLAWAEVERPAASADHACRQADDSDHAAGEQGRAQRIEADSIGHVPLPHVRERTRTVTEGTRVTGQVEEGERRQSPMADLESPVDAGVDQPQQQSADDRDVANAVAGPGPGYRDWDRQ